METSTHTSDCAIYNAPAYEPGVCDCGATRPIGEPVTRSPLTAEVVERNDTPGTWGVEAINMAGDGEIYMTVFSGPGARDRAIEYATAKYADVQVR